MKKFISILLLICTVAMSFGLSGCSKKPKLLVYNWADYIDTETLKSFEDATGCNVVYTTFDSNEAMLSTVKEANVVQDIIVPSDYTIDKMIADGMLEKLDYSKIPNAKYLDARFKSEVFDPYGRYSEYAIPYMWGTVGILYNKKMVTEPVDSWDILFDTKYQKNVLMLDSERDTMAVALKKLGYSLNELDPAKIEEAKNLLIKQKKDGIVKGYRSDEAKGMMVNGEAAMAVCYSGVAMMAMEENSDLAFALPKEGTNVWLDSIVIPKNAQNKELAYKFIDHLCSTEVAKANVDYILYSTPHTEAYKLLDDEIKNNPVLYPSDEYLSTSGCEVFVMLPSDVAQLYKDAYQEITNS